MQIIKKKAALRAQIKNARAAGKSIGFVPTMGFLHQGHLALMNRARQENDLVVVSVFVNPTQFGPNEDLDAYPRDEQRDMELMRAQQVDMAFFPTLDELYPQGYTTYVQVEGPMSQTLCGRSRPTHFRGVTTIVAKLFHMGEPQRAYLGQKDGQQVAVIEQMVRDLDFDIQIIACPTVREKDGLAMSSRNSYLSPEQRAQACVLSQALFEARDMITKGERRAATITQHITDRITSVDGAVIDYVSIVDALDLADIQVLTGKVLIALAVKIGATRLIDNIRIEV
ncbi:MAG: pantoate--beta-alanine ligase [Propionibacteriaceae bacterium]|nr:pantoate--beta-alanine ligase [Propionibacteriaceae bacterium]